MRTLWLVIQREFVSNVLTSRFMIGFIVCLLSTAVAVFVQVDDYEKRLSGYNTAVREAETKAREWDLYVDIKPQAHRKPNPLSIFNVGTENDGANTVTVELGKPIFEFTSTIWGAPTQKRGSDNPFLAMFLSVDVVFIFKIVLSALAILFAYNTVSGEREDGTLKLVLSNSIPRDTVILGKYLGGMLSLFPIVLVSLIVALLIAVSSPVTGFDGNDIAHIRPDIRGLVVVCVNVVSSGIASVSLDKGSRNDANPFDVYLGGSDKRSCKCRNVCSG